MDILTIFCSIPHLGKTKLVEKGGANWLEGEGLQATLGIPEPDTLAFELELWPYYT